MFLFNKYLTCVDCFVKFVAKIIVFFGNCEIGPSNFELDKNILISNRNSNQELV